MSDRGLPPLGTESVGQTAEGRPIISNPDGSFSTERSITVQTEDGRWVNIPSMFGGKQVSDDKALEIMRQNDFVDPETGRRSDFFSTVEDAEAAARSRSDSIQSSPEPLLLDQEPDEDDLSSPYLDTRGGQGTTDAAEELLRRFGAGADEGGEQAQRRVPPPPLPKGAGEEVEQPPTDDEGKPFLPPGGQVIREVGAVVTGGTTRAVQEFSDVVFDLTEPVARFLEEQLPLGSVQIGEGGEIDFVEGFGEGRLELPEPPEPASMAGDIGQGVTQFLVGFIPALRLAKGARVAQGTKAGGQALGFSDRVASAAGKFAEIEAAAALGSVAVFDEQEERLSNLIQQFPALQNPVTEFLAADPEDTQAEGKLKVALESVGLAALVQPFAAGLSALRRFRASRKAEQEQGETVSAAQGESAENGAQEITERDIVLVGDPLKPLIEPASPADAEGFTRLSGLPAGDLAVNINLARLDTSDDIMEAIDTTARLFEGEIDQARRGVQTNEATAALARDMGMTPEQLLRRRRGQAFNAEEALAARQILVSSGDQLVALARKAQSTAASEEDILAFRRALSLHSAIQQQVSGLTAEAGRALQAFRIPAGGTATKERAIRDMLNTAGGADFSRSMAAKLAALDDPAKINDVARKAWGARTADVFLEVWINALLSGPPTHAVNALSNTATALWMVPERLLAAGISRATGSGAVRGGEAAAQAFGLVQGAREGLIAAAKTLRTGEPTDAVAKIEARRHRAISSEALNLSGVPGRAVDYLGEVVRIPGRLLMTSDEFFKGVGYRMEVNALAYRQAAAEGLEGRAFAAKVQELTAHPPEHIQLAAVDASRYQTFTNELGETGQAVQGAAASMPIPLRLVMPFIRTPTNILKFTVERSPMAPLMQQFRQDIAAGGARRDLALARMSLGSLVMAAGADMAMAGMITGGGPSDPGLRAQLRNTGWQPYSIRIGDTYVAYNRLDPMGATLGLAADAAEIMGQASEEDQTNLAAAVVMATAKNLTSKTYLQGLSEAFEVLSDPDRYGERFIQRFAGTVVPTGVAQVERVLDPTLRDARSITDQIRSRIPGYSDELPPRRNMWGDPILLGGGLGPDIISPIYTSQVQSSPVDEELLRLGLPLSMPSRSIGGVELSPHEYSRYVELAGNALKEESSGLGLKDQLELLLDDPQYLEQSDGRDGGKALVIRNLVQAYRQLAQAEMQAEFPELREAIAQKRREGAAALQPQ